ncbi:MAG: hypothetical protein V4677_11480 [Bacteroidota bacterium]
MSTHTIVVFKNGKKFDEVTLDTKTYFLHDLAHYCVEMELRLTQGFWGMIDQGYKMEQLSGKTNEFTEELRRIEHIVGATQSVYIGYMSPEMFDENLKVIHYKVPQDYLEQVIERIKSLINTWNYLPVGNEMEVEFSI